MSGDLKGEWDGMPSDNEMNGKGKAERADEWGDRDKYKRIERKRNHGWGGAQGCG